MANFSRMGTTPYYVGVSTDTKPTSCPVGSRCYEYDTKKWYITYNTGTNWSEMQDLDAVVLGAGTSMIGMTSGVQKTVSVTKALAAASQYHAEDVVSESAAAGTSWKFSAIARADGASGYITKAHVISETTAITPRLVLFIFTATPTSALNDHAANTAMLHADLANYVGKIDLPAMEDIGTGDSESTATSSTTGNLPLAFTCAADADDLYAVVATRDAFTQTAGDDLVIRLTVEQY